MMLVAVKVLQLGLGFKMKEDPDHFCLKRCSLQVPLKMLGSKHERDRPGFDPSATAE